MKSWLASIPVTNLVLFFLALAISLFLLAYLSYLVRRFWRGLYSLELKDRFAIKNDFIKTTAQILGGAFFLLTLYFTYQNLAVSQKNLATTQERNITDLFTKAIEQLGNDKLEVRLGGIYALERIARDSEKDHWPIMEVLTAYVRENAPWSPEDPSVAQKKRPWTKSVGKGTSPLEKVQTNDKVDTNRKPDTDIQAVLTVLGRTAIPYAPKGEKRSLDLRGAYLAGADLIVANLQEAVFFGSNLRGAVLRGANLQGAHLEEANLQGAHLEEADLQACLVVANPPGGKFYIGTNLQRANLNGADLQGAHLRNANLQRASLMNVNLQEADLMGVELQKSYLMGANLKGALLSGANLEDAFLIDVNLQGADLRSAKGLNNVERPIWDEKTRWPEGFIPPTPRQEEKKKGE